MKSNRLKQVWRDGKTAWGMWSSLGSPAVAEAVAQLDVDWILLDAEHGVASYEDMLGLLQATQSSTAASIVRVPANEFIPIKRVLDMGAEGVVVPMVNTAEEAESAASKCRYPPVGTRGLGPHRAARFGFDFPDYFARANTEITLIVQIETPEAVENVEAIAAVKGVDAIFIGPTDLCLTMGHFPNLRHPEFEAAVARVLEAGNAAGKPVGYYCDSPVEAKARADQGFRMVNVANDLTLLGRALRNAVKEAKAAD